MYDRNVLHHLSYWVVSGTPVRTLSTHPDFVHTHQTLHLSIYPGGGGGGLFINHSENEEHRQRQMKICVSMHASTVGVCSLPVCDCTPPRVDVDWWGLLFVHVCVWGQTPATPALSAVSLCSLHGSTPAVSAQGTTGGWRRTGINNATNPCGYIPYAPLLMTVGSPFHQCITARCLGTNSGSKNF